MLRRNFLSLSLLGATSLMLAPRAWAQDAAAGYPNKPVMVIVPFAAGGNTDAFARLVAQGLDVALGQRFLVENKAGAGGNLGVGQLARAEPDGYTLGMGTVSTHAINPTLYKNLPYDPVKSFEPIVELATGSLVLAVHPSVPARSTRELIEFAKSRPGQVTYASPGRGTPQHLAMELFKLNAGVDLRHVPYTGSAGAVKDLLGGHVGAMFVPVHTVLPLAADNQVRLLALGSGKRSTLAPEVPTLAEEGVSGLEVDLWYALSAPAGTPKDIVDRYNSVVNEILASAEVREQFGKQGLVPVGGSPQQLAALIAQDLPRWAKVVKDAGITME